MLVFSISPINGKIVAILHWSLLKVKPCSLDMVYMISSLELQKNNVCFSLNTNNKPKSRKLEETMPVIQIVPHKLNQWLLSVWK